MSSINNRRHERIKHRAKLRVLTHPNEVYILDMRDFSESGLYVMTDDTSIVDYDNNVDVQTLDIDDAPILPSKVIRIDEGKGFAVEFLLD